MELTTLPSSLMWSVKTAVNAVNNGQLASVALSVIDCHSLSLLSRKFMDMLTAE